MKPSVNFFFKKREGAASPKILGPRASQSSEPTAYQQRPHTRTPQLPSVRPFLTRLRFRSSFPVSTGGRGLARRSWHRRIASHRAPRIGGGRSYRRGGLVCRVGPRRQRDAGRGGLYGRGTRRWWRRHAAESAAAPTHTAHEPLRSAGGNGMILVPCQVGPTAPHSPVGPRISERR